MVSDRIGLGLYNLINHNNNHNIYNNTSSDQHQPQGLPQQQCQHQQQSQSQPQQPPQGLPIVFANANTRRITGSEIMSFAVINITTKSSFSRNVPEVRRRGNPQQLLSQQMSGYEMKGRSGISDERKEWCVVEIITIRYEKRGRCDVLLRL